MLQSYSNIPLLQVDPVKPAGHTQLPRSSSKTPPFIQLTSEDAVGKLNHNDTA
jgi:hypothetical protein